MAFGERTRLDDGLSGQEQIKREALLRWAGPDAILPDQKSQNDSGLDHDQSPKQPPTFDGRSNIQFIQYFGPPPTAPDSRFYPGTYPAAQNIGSVVTDSQFENPSHPSSEVPVNPVEDVINKLQDMGLIIIDVEDEQPETPAGNNSFINNGSRPEITLSTQSRQLINRYLPTRRRKLIAMGASAVALFALYQNAENLPYIGSRLNSFNAEQAFNKSPNSEITNKDLNEALKNTLTDPDAKPFAKSNIGNPENPEDSSAGTSFSQPIELTTEIGKLSGEAISLKIINPEVSWQIKIEDPKFRLMYKGDITEEGQVKKVTELFIDPSSIKVIPVITPSNSTWNTISDEVISTQLRSVNPALTDEQLATAKAKAIADITAATTQVARIAQENAVRQTLQKPAVIKGLNTAISQHFGIKLSQLPNYISNEELTKIGIKLKFGPGEAISEENRFSILPEKILEDYLAELAANQQLTELPASIEVTSPIKGLNLVEPTSINANQGV
jgi:hypothetical protein